MAIHPTAIVDKTAQIDPTAEIGPFSIIGPECVVGPESRVGAYVTMERWARLGARNVIHNYACLGAPSQDLKATKERSFVTLGDDNIVREYVTINRATGEGESTLIGHRNVLLAYVHIAHNCRIGNNTIFSNAATLAGCVDVGDFAILGGLAGVHQFCRIGEHAIVGGLTKCTQDVPPYCMADGHPARVFSANSVGLRRRGFADKEIRQIRRAFRILYRSRLGLEEALTEMEANLNGSQVVRPLIDFCRTSRRGIIHPRRK